VSAKDSGWEYTAPACPPRQDWRPLVPNLAADPGMPGANGSVTVTKTLLCGMLLLLAGGVQAGDWPQWRGPYQNGSANERNLPAVWSATENLVWAVDLPGPAAATPVVAGGRVFVSSTAAGSPDLLALCFRARDGKLLWRRQAGTVKRTPPSNTMASPSPVTDGKRVYFFYGTGELAAFEVDGTPRWSRDLAQEYGQFSLMFGYSSSPLLHEGRLYIQVLRCQKPYEWSGPGEWPTDSFLLAVDAATGKTLWKHARQTDARDESQDAYTTPALYGRGRQAKVLVAGADYVTAHDPATGEEVWRLAFNPRQRRNWRLIPTPVPGNGLVYAVTPRGRNPLFAIPADRSGTLAWSDLAWTFERDTPDVCVPLLYRERLYVLDDTTPVLSCLDAATGRQIWQTPLKAGGPYRASPLGADGKVYCINEAGEVTVLAAGDTLQVLSQFTVGEGPCQATIVAAAGRLFLRTAKRLWCVGQ
jgi:outer membrane protein assembly factor BamB